MVQVYHGMNFFLYLITSGSDDIVSGLQLSLTHHLSCGDSRGLILFREAMLEKSRGLYMLIFHIIHLNRVVMTFSSWILTCSLLLWSWWWEHWFLLKGLVNCSQEYKWSTTLIMACSWVAVMKSGTIFTAYYWCIAVYAILFGAMDCVSMYKCYVCMCVCMYIQCTCCNVLLTQDYYLNS